MADISKDLPSAAVDALVQCFDGPLAFAVFLLACGHADHVFLGFDVVPLYGSWPNMLIAGFIMFVVAQIPPQRLMTLAVPLYVMGVTLLIAWPCLASPRGRQRWLNVGITIQPSVDPQDCHALDAGLVVPEARRQLRPLTLWWPPFCW